MRFITFSATALALSLLAGSAGAAGFSVRGNDTGGKIAWSPEAEGRFQQIADEHCSWWDKAARITSYHPRQGDYIGFVCEFPRGYDPRKGAWRFQWRPFYD